MSLITDTIGGIMGGHAAGTAANAQVGGAQEAASTVQNATAQANGRIQQETGSANAGVVNAGLDAADGALTASSLASAGLDPYTKAGSAATDRLSAGLAAGGEFDKSFSADQMEQNDPGYAFRLAQGSQALERSQAAHGAAQGGAAARALMDYGEAAGSAEYGAAFTRFRQSQQDKVANLQDLSHTGETAATTQGGFGVNGAQYAGTMRAGTQEWAGANSVQSAETQAANTDRAAEYAGNSQVFAGNARAAGILGKQSAYNGMLSGIGSGIDSAVSGFIAPAPGGGMSGWTGALKGISKG